MTFIAPRNAADALQRRGIAVHRRERGLWDSSLRFFCRNCQKLWLPHWAAPVDQDSASTGFGVSFNNSSARALLFFLFACFTVLHFCITRCATGQSFEDAFPTLRQVLCGAARKGSHLPFRLSGVRRGS